MNAMKRAVQAQRDAWRNVGKTIAIATAVPAAKKVAEAIIEHVEGELFSAERPDPANGNHDDDIELPPVEEEESSEPDGTISLIHDSRTGETKSYYQGK